MVCIPICKSYRCNSEDFLRGVFDMLQSLEVTLLLFVASVAAVTAVNV